MVVSGARTQPLDVLIAGGGPTGLTAGCLLARRGFAVRIVRKHKLFTGHSRATGLWPRALEILEPVGVVGELTAMGNHITRFGYYSSGDSIGCFSIDSLAQARFRYLLAVSQHRIEAALQTAFLAAGGDLCEGEVVGLDQDDRRVRVRVRAQARDATMTARYLIGADGANGAVRGLLGLAMNDVGPTLSYRLADAVVSGLPKDQGNYCWSPAGGMGVVPHDRDAYRLAYRLTPQAPDASLKSFQRLLDDRGPREHHATVRELLTTADFQTRYTIVDRFAAGRCFLAGDAAHLMSPAGAQGMNAGILDAAALARRIEHVLNGTAPADALSSYDPERQSAIRKIMAIVMKHSRDGALTSPADVAVRDRQYREMADDPDRHANWVTQLCQLHIDTKQPSRP